MSLGETDGLGEKPGGYLHVFAFLFHCGLGLLLVCVGSQPRQKGKPVIVLVRLSWRCKDHEKSKVILEKD